MRQTNDRLVVGLLGGLALLGALWLRCVWLQVVAAHRYAALALSQHQSAQTLPARRGPIVDRAGRVLAMSVPAPSIFANARAVTAKRQVAAQLASLSGVSAAEIRNRLAQDRGFVWIARQVTPEVMTKLTALRDRHIGIVEEGKRSYPHGRLASHLLGCVDIDQRGLEGLELMFNGVLRGQPGWRSTWRDAKGQLLIGPWTAQTKPVDGDTVVVTIDTVIQQAAEETLAWGIKRYHAKGGSIIIMEPSTGAILALANDPSYDPNAPGESPAERRRNRAITDLFEPGSTFKVVTAAALLEEGRITPEETIFCERGAYHTVARHILHDHQPHGTLSFRDVVALSSNIGVAKAAQRLTPEELAGYLQAFGFGKETGIDLPGEVRGLVSSPARWSKLSPFIIPIGQEVGVTPMQLAVMTAVVANGGLRVRPYVVDHVETPEGRVVYTSAGAGGHRVISPATAATLQEILVRAVESGTGQMAKVQGLIAAGKTGTAQKLEPTGRYSHSRFVASFVGFAPVPDPRLVIVVCIDEPRPVYFGGVVAAPMFKRVVEQLVSYLGLDRDDVA